MDEIMNFTSMIYIIASVAFILFLVCLYQQSFRGQSEHDLFNIIRDIDSSYRCYSYLSRQDMGILQENIFDCIKSEQSNFYGNYLIVTRGGDYDVPIKHKIYECPKDYVLAIYTLFFLFYSNKSHISVKKYFGLFDAISCAIDDNENVYNTSVVSRKLRYGLLFAYIGFLNYLLMNECENRDVLCIARNIVDRKLPIEIRERIAYLTVPEEDIFPNSLSKKLSGNSLLLLDSIIEKINECKAKNELSGEIFVLEDAFERIGMDCKNFPSNRKLERLLKKLDSDFDAYDSLSAEKSTNALIYKRYVLKNNQVKDNLHNTISSIRLLSFKSI